MGCGYKIVINGFGGRVYALCLSCIVAELLVNNEYLSWKNIIVTHSNFNLCPRSCLILIIGFWFQEFFPTTSLGHASSLDGYAVTHQVLVGEPVEALTNAILHHLGNVKGGNFAKKDVYHKLMWATNLAVMDLYNEFGPFIPVPTSLAQTMPLLYKITTFNYFDDKLFPKTSSRKPALSTSSGQWSNIPNVIYALILMTTVEGKQLFSFFNRLQWLSTCRVTREGMLELKKGVTKDSVAGLQGGYEQAFGTPTSWYDNWQPLFQVDATCYKNSPSHVAPIKLKDAVRLLLYGLLPPTEMWSERCELLDPNSIDKIVFSKFKPSDHFVMSLNISQFPKYVAAVNTKETADKTADKGTKNKTRKKKKDSLDESEEGAEPAGGGVDHAANDENDDMVNEAVEAEVEEDDGVDNEEVDGVDDMPTDLSFLEELTLLRNSSMKEAERETAVQKRQKLHDDCLMMLHTMRGAAKTAGRASSFGFDWIQNGIYMVAMGSYLEQAQAEWTSKDCKDVKEFFRKMAPPTVGDFYKPILFFIKEILAHHAILQLKKDGISKNTTTKKNGNI